MGGGCRGRGWRGRKGWGRKVGGSGMKRGRRGQNYKGMGKVW